MSVPVLGTFPNTIANLPDRPNLGPQQMKEALQADIATAWPYIQALITEVNASSGFAPLPLSIDNGGTGATTKADALAALGITVGKGSPASVASGLATGDIYIYAPTLP
jgi:hypothetical protein